MITSDIGGQDSCGENWAENLRAEDEIACLKRVHKGDPSDVSDSKHEAEAIGRDVHGGEDSRLRRHQR